MERWTWCYGTHQGIQETQAALKPVFQTLQMVVQTLRPSHDPWGPSQKDQDGEAMGLWRATHRELCCLFCRSSSMSVSNAWLLLFSGGLMEQLSLLPRAIQRGTSVHRGTALCDTTAWASHVACSLMLV